MSGMENTKSALLVMVLFAALAALSIAIVKIAIWFCGGPTLAALILTLVLSAALLLAVTIIIDLRSK